MKDLNIKARLFAAIAVFKAEHDIRYYLNGVLVEPDPAGGAFIVATNGHAMAVWRDETATGVERPIIIRTDNRLLQACNGSYLKRLVVRDNRLAVVLIDDDKELYIQPIEAKKRDVPAWEVEGKFPDWVKVVPRQVNTGIKGAVNPHYINMAEKAVRIGSGIDKFSGLMFDQCDENGSILVQSSYAGADDFLGVIMPMRQDKPKYPKWMKAKKAEWEAEDAKRKSQAVAIEADPGTDPLYDKAVAIVREECSASVSMVQRHLCIGYSHAARLIEHMEKMGVVSIPDGNGTRFVVQVATTEGGA